LRAPALRLRLAAPTHRRAQRFRDPAQLPVVRP
jgi:hypothetical protein